MLIIDKIETILITPPKTGSVSAHWRWAKDDVGAFWVYGKQPNGRIGSHVNFKIAEYQYRTAALIRDPYERALSFRKHLKDYRQVEQTIDELIDDLLSGDDWFSEPLSMFLPAVDEYWPIEMINQIADHYSLPHLPRLNVGDERMTETFSADQMQRLRPWAESDITLHNKAMKYWQKKL
jgi:hypothetical protein